MKNLLIWNGMASKQVSGGDTYTKLLISGLGGIDLVLTSRANKLLGKTKAQIVYVVDEKVANNGLGISWLYIKRAFKTLGFLIRNKHNYGLVIAASPFVCDVLPAAFSDSNRRAVVLFHLLPKRSSKGLLTKLRFYAAALEQKTMLAIINHRFDIIMTGNEEVRERLSNMFPRKTIIISHAGIDTSRIDVAPTTKKDPNLAVFVGRLTVQKGILDLPDIIFKIQQGRPDFRVIIVGDGPDKALFQRKITESGAKNIDLKGFVSTKEKDQLLKYAQFFLFPSYEEGWGIALAEALYAECQAVTYELDHYRGIFDDYPLYVPLGDIDAFAKAVARNYDKQPMKGQKKFIAKYKDVRVVQDVVKQLGVGD